MDYSARHQLFRDLLRRVRTDAGFTQIQLAEKLGKPQSFVSKAETGERRLDFLETLDYCTACGASLDVLVSGLCSPPGEAESVETTIGP